MSENFLKRFKMFCWYPHFSAIDIFCSKTEMFQWALFTNFEAEREQNRKMMNKAPPQSSAKPVLCVMILLITFL